MCRCMKHDLYLIAHIKTTSKWTQESKSMSQHYRVTGGKHREILKNIVIGIDFLENVPEAQVAKTTLNSEEK